MSNWKEIRKEWETTKVTFKKLAEKHNVKEGTLKSRRSREKWSRNPTNKKDATFKKDATQKTKRMQPKRGAPKGNKNAKGNSGNSNPDNQFTERNTKALKHGLFSRYIPKETLEIMGMMDKEPADLIHDQIMIQYAAIIRAQQIMFVEDKHEIIKELKKLKTETVPGSDVQIPIEKEYEFQFAWDRHANFMNAQSRAMSEFRSLVKQFLEMTNEDDARRLQLEQMQLGIEKTKAEIENITSGDTEEKPIEIVIKRKRKDDDS